MTNQDALVAEAVGYVWTKTQTDFRDSKFRKWLRYLVPGVESDYYHHDDDGEGHIDPLFSYQYVPPFISAATAATDQIVLEWVQGQDYITIGVFFDELKELLAGGKTGSFIDELEQMKNYKPGMFAQALLAIQEERGE